MIPPAIIKRPRSAERGRFHFRSDVEKRDHLPEPIPLLHGDVGDQADHGQAACGDEEGPVDVGEPQVLVRQQVAARGVGGDDAVLVAVQELPLVGDLVLQVQAAVGGVVAGQGDLHPAGQDAVIAQTEGQAVLVGGEGQQGAELALGAADLAAVDAQGVVIAQHDEAAAGLAQGVQDLGSDRGHLALGQGDLVPGVQMEHNT